MTDEEKEIEEFEKEWEEEQKVFKLKIEDEQKKWEREYEEARLMGIENTFTNAYYITLCDKKRQMEMKVSTEKRLEKYKNELAREEFSWYNTERIVRAQIKAEEYYLELINSQLEAKSVQKKIISTSVIVSIILLIILLGLCVYAGIKAEQKPRTYTITTYSTYNGRIIK